MSARPGQGWPYPYFEGGHQRHGLALILVVIMVALVATAGLSFALLMQQSNQSAAAQAERQQSQWARESAVAMLMSWSELTRLQPVVPEGLPPKAWLVRSLNLGDGEGVLTSSSLSLGGSGGTGVRGLGAVNEPDATMGAGFGSASFDAGGGMAANESTGLAWQDDEPVRFESAEPGYVVYDWDVDSGDGQRNLGETMISESGWGGQDSVASGEASGVTMRLGWTAESGKLSLQRLLAWEQAAGTGAALLQGWCGLDPAQADALLDWLDSDDDVRPFGLEAEGLAAAGYRYRPLNRVPSSIEPLMLVPGLPPQVWVGTRDHWNLSLENWYQDPNEQGGIDSALEGLNQLQEAQIERDLAPDLGENSATTRARVEALGLARFLTCWARERHVNVQGLPKIVVHQRDLQRLFSEVSTRLDPAAATYVCVARQFGVRDGQIESTSEGQTLASLDDISPDFGRPAAYNFSSLVALIDSHVQIPSDNNQILIVNSPWTLRTAESDFPAKCQALFEQLTTAPELVTDSRLHWQEVDPDLLPWVPGLEESTRELLSETGVAVGESSGATPGLAFQAATWFAEGRLSKSQWSLLDREFTDRSCVYSASIFSHAGDYRSIQWARVVIDASESPPRQVYCQEVLPPPPALPALSALIEYHVRSN